MKILVAYKRVVDSNVRVQAEASPAKRGKGVMVKDAAELVAALKQKGLL